MTKKTLTNSILRNIGLPLLSIALIFLLWTIIAIINNNPLVLPTPNVVFEHFILLFCKLKFWKSVGATLLRTLISFLISFSFAIISAILSKHYNNIKLILFPIISILRSAPTVVVILIAYAFMNSNTMSVVVGILIAFPIMYASFLNALDGLNPDLFKMANVYKFSIWDKIVNIYILSILSNIFDTAKATISLTFKIIIAAEILTYVPTSIGGEVQTAYASFEIGYLLAWALVAITFGFILEIIISLLKKFIVRWKI